MWPLTSNYGWQPLLLLGMSGISTHWVPMPVAQYKWVVWHLLFKAIVFFYQQILLSALPCNLAWTEFVHLAKEKLKYCVSTKRGDTLCQSEAPTLEEQKSASALKQFILWEQGGRRDKCHSVLAFSPRGHHVSWLLMLGFLGSGLVLIQSSNNSGTNRVS